jgi:hypothetical protein
MATLKTLKKAREAALKGEIQPALDALRGFASAGDDSAAASVAELAGFQGGWDEVIAHAGRLIANPGAVYAGNIFDDMVRLLGRSGHETAQWDVIGSLAVSAKETIGKGVTQEHLRVRYVRILDELGAYAARRGGPPHELVAVFGGTGDRPRDPKKEEAAYRDAVDNVHVHRPNLKGKPEELARHLFALAVTYGKEEDALRLHAQHGHAGPFDFDAAVHVAKVLVRRGKPDDAWQAVQAKLAAWIPVDKAQVAPAVLIVDDDLRKIMSPERCKAVLATPRGPAAR